MRSPIVREGAGISTDALAAAVERSDGYPYFIQEWGYALWMNAASAGDSEISMKHVRAVEAAVEREIKDFTILGTNHLRTTEACGAGRKPSPRRSRKD